MTDAQLDEENMMQRCILLISAFIAMLLTSACNTETNTFYYTIENRTPLSLFDEAINTEGELKGSICKISIDANITKALKKIAKSGQKMEGFLRGMYTLLSLTAKKNWLIF